MKRTILASVAAAGGLALLTMNLLTPTATPPGTEPARTENQARPVPVTAVPEQKPEPELLSEPEPASQTWDGTHEITILIDGKPQRLPLDDYLTGVVLAEMPPSFETEALSAQAVAARTLVCRRLETPKHDGAAVCGQSSCCQAYLSEPAAREKYGADWTKWESRVRSAVEATDGLTICYQGELIDAVYFSSAGGATEKAAAVWGGEVPYLQSVVSPDAEERFTEETRFTTEDFHAAILRETPDAKLDSGPAGWFGAAYRTEGGGVERISIGGIEYSGVQLRRLFSLRSTNFTISVEGDEIVIQTHGNGHRVGMSQYGAQAMALDGKDFREILTHYYQGVEIVPA